MCRASEISAAMDDSRVWGLLKGKEVLVLGTLCVERVGWWEEVKGVGRWEEVKGYIIYIRGLLKSKDVLVPLVFHVCCVWREGGGGGGKGIYTGTPQKQRRYDIRAIHTSYGSCVYLGTGTPQKQRCLRSVY